MGQTLLTCFGARPNLSTISCAVPSRLIFRSNSQSSSSWLSIFAYQQTGKPEEARRAAEQLMAARPDFTVAAWLKTQFSRRDATQVEADTAALRAAGLPPC